MITLLQLGLALLATGLGLAWQRLAALGRKLDEVYTEIELGTATAREIQANKDRIDAVVEMMLRNARTEGLAKGLITINSPVEVTDLGRRYFAKMADDLRDFYRKVGVALTDNELFLEIQRRFGDRLFDDVCVPLRLIHNSCILVAMEIAKEGQPPDA